MEITLTLDTDNLSPEGRKHLAALILETNVEPEQLTFDDSDIEQIAAEMYDAGLECKPGTLYRAPELFRRARPDQSWNNLPSSTRKVLGRRFRKFTEEMQEEASPGDLIVVFAEKTIQGAALYQTQTSSKD